MDMKIWGTSERVRERDEMHPPKGDKGARSTATETYQVDRRGSEHRATTFSEIPWHYNDPHDEIPALCEADQPLIAAIQGGLPLSSHPYAVIAEQIGSTEKQVIDRIGELQQLGIIKRLGVVVRHRELGYRANAMVVWDVPDNEVDELGRCLSGFEFVTLCYRRPRHLPQWPYNLFCMIHGRDREAVLEKFHLIITSCGLEEIPKAVLFSRRRFKQRGAIYRPDTAIATRRQ